MSTPHWPHRRQIGLGALDPNSPAITSAAAVMDWFSRNPCSRQSLAVVSQFQTDYNGSGLPGSLTVDGQYGPNTQRALQNVLDSVGPMATGGSGPSQTAPTNCFPELGQVPSIPAVDVVNPPPVPVTPAAPVTPATPTTPTVAPSGKPTNIAPYVVGGAALAGAGVIGYALWRRSRRRK